MYESPFKRHKTRVVVVGGVPIGGDHPIVVQSMTTPDTHQLEATLAEIHRLEEAGCEMVRVTVPKPEDAAVLGEIKRRIKIPLICDIHFDYKMALAALDHPVDKIRINPGNIGGMDRFKQVLKKAKDKGIPMRIGVNAGSLEREFAMKYGFPCPPAMVDSALRYIEIAESVGYHDLIVSLKSSDVATVVEAYRLYAKQAELSDASGRHRGLGAGGAVCDDQVGVRARADPARRHRRHPFASACSAIRSPRIAAAFEHPARRHAAAGPAAGADQRGSRRCGRLEDRSREGSSPSLSEKLAHKKTAIKISVLGCIVNGPGEAKEADLGIAAGKGKGVIYKRGEIIRHVLEKDMVPALMEEIAIWEIEEAEKGTLKTGAPAIIGETPKQTPISIDDPSRMSLPVVG